MKKWLLLLAISLYTSASLHADSVEVFKPNCILVMLNESLNAIEGLKKRGRTEDIKQIQERDREINTSIIQEFHQHFSYCPVYYFYNKDYDLVKAKQWGDVAFFDYQSLSIKKQIELTNPGNYYIAEINYPPPASYSLATPGKEASSYTEDDSYANSRDYHLLLYDESFRLLARPLGITNISLRRTGNIFKPETLSYRFRGADKLQAKLERYARP